MDVRQLTRQILTAAAVGTLSLAAPLRLDADLSASAPVVQAPTLQAALAGDVAQMGEKFVGLARVLDGKYDWRPGAGVRSVGEVLNLIVAENGMLTGVLTGAPAGTKPAPITTSAQMQAALKTSYATLQEAISKLSDADLNANASIFGRNTTKRGAILLVVGDQHEHLGQSIAYARVNGVVPPWSK